MPRKLHYGSGSVQIEMDDTLSDLATRLIRESYAGVLEAVERETQQVYEAAKAAWPMRTGKSRAALEWGVRINPPDSLEGFIRNPATKDGVHYVYAMRFAVREGYGHVWTDLIRRPMRTATKRLVREVGPEIARAATGGR